MILYNQRIAELTNLLYRNTYQTDRTIKTRLYIDSNFEKPITLDTIESAVYSSKFHLNRQFKRYYGLTPKKYLKEKRILEAKTLLKHNSTVTDACFYVGYESLTTFSMLFRKWTGSLPSDLKKARMKK